MNNKKVITKVQETINILQHNFIKDVYNENNDLCDCFISVLEELQNNEIDYKYINYKLSTYFSNQFWFVGNLCADGELYVNEYDILECKNDILEYVIKACEYTIKNNNK